MNVKTRLSLYVYTGNRELQALSIPGTRFMVQLEGPDASVQKVIDLELRPILADERGHIMRLPDDNARIGPLLTGGGAVIRWYDPAGHVQSFDAPGGFKSVFNDIALSVLAVDIATGEELRLTSAKDIEPSAPTPPHDK